MTSPISVSHSTMPCNLSQLAKFAHHVGPLTGADSEADMCSACVYVRE